MDRHSPESAAPAVRSSELLGFPPDAQVLIVNCDALLTQAGCTAALHVRRLSDDAEIALRADETWLAASVIKVAIAVEFYA